MMLFSSRTPAADKPSSASGETAAEKLRKALDRVRDLEIAEQPLDAAVNQLREQTGINFTIDRAITPNAPGFSMLGGGPGAPASGYAHLNIGGPFHRLPLRVILTKMLGKHNLTHVLVGDAVLITTPDKAVERQLGQTISINIKEVALSDALKQLARETGANLVLDRRAAKEGQAALTLRLDEVPLESAVELLADEADLRAVRLGNVLYVTSAARARKLRKPRPAPAAPPQGWQIQQDNFGGFRLTPLNKNDGGR
jgi:type II secretory pathway component GspD/PulD (secretin)